MRILVVEDEKSISDFLKTSLEEECFVVDVASDGEEGSFLARTNDYDLVILDNVLPKKSGKEVCQDLRGRGRLTPIIMLSAKAEVSDKVDLLDTGADDYLAKPFSFIELKSRIKALLRRPRNVEGSVLKVDDLEVDTREHSVKRAGKEVYLTRKELMLLEFLMRNKGAVVSRSAIMEHVWDIHADPFSNTIESHIFSLRKKIGGAGGKKLIHTIPGRGYKLSA
jgi:two-component system copper resistance phosphate regulon response regulator CusR